MFYQDCTAFEIKAYRQLENETFDFGTGEMKIEGLLGSEDAYYQITLDEMEEQRFLKELSNLVIEPEGYEIVVVKKGNSRKRKREDQKRIGSLYNKTCMLVSKEDGYYKRHYLSGKRQVLRRRSNKKVRQYKGVINNGSHYKRIYDFDWNLY